MGRNREEYIKRSPSLPYDQKLSGRIEMGKSLETRIVEHAASTFPSECCGFLVGSAKRGARVVESIIKAENLKGGGRTDRFEIDPREFMDADKVARKSGGEILGFYHSHPDCPCYPSMTDRERAWPEYSYIIVEMRGDRTYEIKSWVLDEVANVFIEELLVIAVK